MEENIQGTAPRKSTMMPIVIGVVALLLLGGVALFATQNRNASQTTNPQPTAVTEENVAPTEAMSEDQQSTGATEQEGAEKTFTVTGSSFKFDPAEIRVKKGDKVTIVFNNSGGMHDWVIDEFNARTKVLQSGASETISFVADQAGTFEYYCSVGQHRQMGMKGNLVIE